MVLLNKQPLYAPTFILNVEPGKVVTAMDAQTLQQTSTHDAAKLHKSISDI
jgi:hypothetical protein